MNAYSDRIIIKSNENLSYSVKEISCKKHKSILDGF